MPNQVNDSFIAERWQTTFWVASPRVAVGFRRPLRHVKASVVRGVSEGCPACRRSQGEIVTQTHSVIGFKCRECDCKWWAEHGNIDRTTH
jgi:hypothetical protein